MRQVKLVRFQTGYHELWGRKVTVLRAQDGYKMRFWPESGVLLIDDAKDGGEVVVHVSRCDVYLEPESVAATPAAPEQQSRGAQPRAAGGAPLVK